MNYDRIFLLLAKRYARRNSMGFVRCADCENLMDVHECWCQCGIHAKKLLARALREKGRR